jgi:hypothetical protein
MQGHGIQCVINGVLVVAGTALSAADGMLMCMICNPDLHVHAFVKHTVYCRSTSLQVIQLKRDYFLHHGWDCSTAECSALAVTNCKCLILILKWDQSASLHRKDLRPSGLLRSGTGSC